MNEQKGDESVQEFLRSTPYRPEKRPVVAELKATKEMSRGAMTFFICGTLLLMGLVALYFVTRADPSSPYAHCQQIIGWDDDCRTNESFRILRGY